MKINAGFQHRNTLLPKKFCVPVCVSEHSDVTFVSVSVFNGVRIPLK